MLSYFSERKGGQTDNSRADCCPAHRKKRKINSVRQNIFHERVCRSAEFVRLAVENYGFEIARHNRNADAERRYKINRGSCDKITRIYADANQYRGEYIVLFHQFYVKKRNDEQKHIRKDNRNDRNDTLIIGKRRNDIRIDKINENVSENARNHSADDFRQ